MTVLANTIDPDGRGVELTDERWQHILDAADGHPELAGHQDEVMRAVHAPEERRPGRKANEEWFFLRNVGPSRWLQVVVAYEQERGWIVTAFGRRRNP
jgi:hypothetical protein